MSDSTRQENGQATHFETLVRALLDKASGRSPGMAGNQSAHEAFLELGTLLNITSSTDDPEVKHETTLRYAVIVFLYTLVVVASFGGNGLVCWAIYAKKRLRNNVNFMIANLTASDLMMTAINIPFSCARLLMKEWIFGKSMCVLVPFAQSTSVYVSSLTMTYIAFDRYQVIAKPLRDRARRPVRTVALYIWIISATLSLPHAIFNDVVTLDLGQKLQRCWVVYPKEHALLYRQAVDVGTFATQYLVPLLATVFAYVKTCRLLSHLGANAPSSLRTQAKKSTIKMLIMVVAVFACAWMPLNLYYILVDFYLLNPSFNLVVFLHLIAMSSVCYNPFIYFSLNKHFSSALNCLRCCDSYKSSSGPKIRRHARIRMNEIQRQALDNKAGSSKTLNGAIVKTAMTSL